MKHQPSMYALVPTANPKRLTAPANWLILLSDERYWQASASDPRCILILLQRDTRALGIGQGCAATASHPRIRNDYCHSNSVRIASPLCANMISGKDTGSAWARGQSLSYLLSWNEQQGPRNRTDRLIFKIIAFLAAAIPIFLFIRSIFFRRTTRINEGLREFKKQANLAVSIFLFLIVCVVVFAAGKLAWTWWLSL